ncbi:MAG: DUF4340 domain-containing protein [Bacteroidota bacterium]
MKRPTLFLVALLVVLAGVATWVIQKPGEQSRATAAGDRLVQVDSARIDRIDIRGSSGSVQLERRGMEWFVASPVDARANVSSIAGALGQASDLRVKNIVSTKPEKHTLFQVDSAGGTSVTMYEGGDVRAAFIVGKPAEGYTDTYVRAIGSDEVALVTGSFGWTFNRAVRDWRDRAILTIARPDLREVRYQYGDTTFVLAIHDSVWVIDGRTANGQAVESVLTALSSLQCDDFVDAPVGGKVVAIVTVVGQQLRFSRETGGTRYLVQTSAAPQWYALESWRADQLLKRKKDLL